MLRGTRRALLGGRVAEAVAGGWWDPNSDGLSVWAAYAAKGAADLAASYTDLSGNSHDAGVGVAPTWDAVNGWKGDGATMYLTTGFSPQTDQSQTLLVQFTNGTAQAVQWLAGARSIDTRIFGIQSRYYGDMQYMNGSILVVTPNIAAGNLAVAGNQGYRNGAVDGGAIGGYVGGTGSLYIFCRNQAGTAQQFSSAYIQAFALYDTALTAPQVSAIAAAMAAL